MMKTAEERSTAKKIKLLASPVRLRILRILEARGSLSVKQLASRLELSQPAASHQLLMLSDAGFIEVREAGSRHYYSANLENISAALRDAAIYLGLVEAS